MPDICRNRGPYMGPERRGIMLTFLSRLFSAGKEVTSLGLGGPELPKPARLVYVLLTAWGQFW